MNERTRIPNIFNKHFAVPTSGQRTSAEAAPERLAPRPLVVHPPSPSSGRRPLNQRDLKRYRKALEGSKLGLLQIATKTLREEANVDADDLPDEVDLASSEYAQSVIFRLRDREKFLFKMIERALTRIEEGTFGICERCQETISPKRLDAYPVSTLCIWCKEEQEDGLIARRAGSHVP